MAKPLPASRLAALLGVACICSGGCEREPGQHSPSATVKLRPGKWVPSVRAELQALIARNGGKGRKVVFDFDNTLICRDIGEATFAAMVEGGTLVPTPAARAVSPSFVHEGRRVSVQGAADLIPYYEAFVSATDHQPGNTDPGFSSFAWLVQVMAGLTPADIVRSTREAYAGGIGKRDSSDPGLGETKVNGYRRPFFQPEMVDLVGALLGSGYDVYVVSASNVWTVRWMVTKQLNALMRAEDADAPLIPPDHVIGVSVLLSDTRTGRLYKDQLLVKENRAYANLDLGELANYRLTTRIAPPLSGYFGKVANIMKHVDLERPLLVAGDSPNDHPMLVWAENRLWMARLEKRDYQEKTVALMGGAMPGRWFVQPVLYKASPGFVPSRSDLQRRLRAAPEAFNAADESARLLESSGRLKGF